MGVVSDGLAWLASNRKAVNSRAVTYRRPSAGVSVDITAAIGQTQAVNVNALGIEPSVLDVAILGAEATNRDYIVEASDLAALWPPRSGDLIDDANDVAGSVNRFQVMSLPGQNPWRWFRGGYQKHARVHTKFLSVYAPLWLDEFTGANHTAIGAHAPDSPDGGAYSGGDGTIEILSNRIVAGSASASAYFDAGETDATTRVNLSLNAEDADLAEKYAEMGLGVRCTGSGAGLRDGYYGTLRVGYSANIQSIRRLRLIKRASGVSTEMAGLDLPDEVELTTTYRLQMECGERITLSLFDVTGEIAIASVGHEPDDFAEQTAGAVFFAHHEDLNFSLPWLDRLEVEA